MRILAGSLLALAIVCGGATPAAATTITVCALYESSSFDNQCGSICGWITSVAGKKPGLPIWRPGSLVWKPVPPATTLPTGPKTVASCDVVPKEPPKGHCVATVCGLADVKLLVGKRPPGSATVAPAKLITTPCGGPDNPCRVQRPSAVVTPGLLEGDSGFATQGPAGAGVPGRTTGGGSGTSSSYSVRPRSQ